MSTDSVQNVFEVTGPAPGVTFLLWRVNGAEEMGRGFEYSVELLSETEAVTAADVLGKSLSIKINIQGQDPRYIHGLVCRFERLGQRKPFFAFRFLIRPWLWFLNHTADCRIFQNKSIQDILTDVFKTKNAFSDFRFNLTGTYTTREYCVQYRESDFHFASRLMEEEGMYYYFEHATDKHTLVILDDAASHTAIGGNPIRFNTDGEAFGETEVMRKWSPCEELWTTSFTVRDYDFEKPSTLLNSKAQIAQTHSLSSFEWYDYPNNFKEVADGNHYATVWAESRQARFSQAAGTASSYRLIAGLKFTMSEYVDEAENVEYIIIGTNTTIQSGEIRGFSAESVNRVAVDLRAMKSTLRFRAERTTHRPMIPGPQSAIVVGKQGEEIWTDKYGRVKVQFYWDRVGVKDENSSCWLRVAQVWAGANWGGIEIPRMGQEVLVQFMDGNPDRPIIVGRVYNADQMPPYALPDNQTKSGLKTRSSKEGAAENFNELRFEDKKDSEEVYFHAERDFNRVVENNDTLKVGFEKKTDGNQTIDIYNNRTLKVGVDGAADGSETIEVWKNQTVTIGKSASDGSQTLKIYKDETKTIETGNRSLTISKGNETIKIDTGNRETTIAKGNDTLTVTKGNLSITVTAGTCTIEAGTSIELKVGSSSIKIESAAITIKSADVTVEGTGTAEVKSPSTTVNGSGTLTLKGGMININ